MGMLDGLLNQLGGHSLDGLAERVGLTPDQVQAGLSALHRAAPQPGDTATQASAETGLPVDALRQLLSHLGGEERLGQLAGAFGGEGGVGGMLGGMFGRS